jgi:DNA repair exonuclease SbcCD ATPase subunit
MIRKVLFALLIASAVLAGCDTKEKAVLQTKVDSLSVELEASQRVAQTMQEVGSLMDSIDASRQLLKVNMAEGTSYENYTERMKELNNFVKESQSKITALEDDLKKSTSSSSSISKSVSRLKKDLESKNQEIVELQEQVEKYRNENQNLIQTVGLQEAMLEDKEGEILTKHQELALIEARIQELMIQSKMTEADAYYARASAVEEAANRTKLAPKKKKETLKEAVELYKKALSLGKNEAQAKIEELEKKI